MDWRRLGERVQARRGALGLSRDDLARRAGIDASTIAAIETEDKPRRAQTLGRLERALGWQEGAAWRIANGEEPLHHDLALTGADEQPAMSPEDAIEAEPYFTREEKDAMLTMLAALRSRGGRAQGAEVRGA